MIVLDLTREYSLTVIFYYVTVLFLMCDSVSDLFKYVTILFNIDYVFNMWLYFLCLTCNFIVCRLYYSLVNDLVSFLEITTVYVFKVLLQ